MAELPIQTVREAGDRNAMARAMADLIFGPGVEVRGASYTGDSDSAGIFSNANNVSPGVTPGDTGVILSTGDAEDFTNASGQVNQSNSTSTNTSGPNDNALFNTAAGARTYDASYLDVDFVPDSSVMTMLFVFSSEEYPEFQNSIYQDFVGIWVNGTQLPFSAADRVQVDVGDGEIDPGNINTSNNINMFVNNTNDAFNTEMDGFTITMTVTMNVVPNQVNSIRIGVADVSDNQYDSNLLIAANSVQTELVAISDNVNVYPNGVRTFDVLSNDVTDGPPGSLSVTHVNGQPIIVGGTVVLPTGQIVTLNPNGTLSVEGDGDTENFNFTYSVTDGTITDVGYVNATSVPCFVAGTLIDTPSGPVPVERLRVGDLILTQDEGAQPLRWMGTRTVLAEGNFAPVYIAENSFGTHGAIRVSPLHRVLVRDTLAELLFGEAEVLVAARDLIDGRNVVQKAGGTVTYVHLMFDRHQVVFSDGLATESFLPGPQTTDLFERSAIGEICEIFPQLDPHSGAGYSASARRTLRRFEADLLMQSTREVA
jgi:hypothetical protein